MSEDQKKGYSLQELWDLYLERGGTPEEISTYMDSSRKKQNEWFYSMTVEEREKQGYYISEGGMICREGIDEQKRLLPKKT